MKSVSFQDNSILRIGFEKDDKLIISNYKSIEVKIKSNSEIQQDKNVVLEITLPKHVSSYALLGVEYICDNSVSSLSVEIRYNDDMRFDITNNYNVIVGLLKEYAEAVEAGVKSYFSENDVPKGKLIFHSAMQCNVRSSFSIFFVLTQFIVELCIAKKNDITDFADLYQKYKITNPNMKEKIRHAFAGRLIS